MNLYFRLLFLLFKRIIQKPKKIDVLGKCETTFLVNPLDLDVNFHMNNGRYLSLMDLGRVDLMIKIGIFGKLFKNGFYPVVVSEGIRFKKSLELFQVFKVITQIECVDEKDFYISQKFYHKKQICAEGFIKGRFKKRGRRDSIPQSELFDFLGLQIPEIPKEKKAKALDDLTDSLVKN